jgi:hypothetical protein
MDGEATFYNMYEFNLTQCIATIANAALKVYLMCVQILVPFNLHYFASQCTISIHARTPKVSTHPLISPSQVFDFNSLPYHSPPYI